MSYCSEAVEIEIGGEAQTVTCTQAKDHPEDHSAKIWWASDNAQEVTNSG